MPHLILLTDNSATQCCADFMEARNMRVPNRRVQEWWSVRQDNRSTQAAWANWNVLFNYGQGRHYLRGRTRSAGAVALGLSSPDS